MFVLNDWIGDTSTWDDARKYLDCEGISWLFTDLRGYGRSKALRGAYTVEEAAHDVLQLADALGLSRFAVVGHSMSTLVALHLAQHHADRLRRAVVITPAPPAGFGADVPSLEPIHALARGDDELRHAWLRMRLGDSLSPGWVQFKLQRWRIAADPEAVAGYATMFARDGLPDPTARIHVPLLAITCERDVPPLRREVVASQLGPLCDQLTLESIEESGHYPMQETPPLLAARVERFLVVG